MQRHTCLTLAILTILAIPLLAACNPPPPHKFVDGDNDEFPRLLFESGNVSSNDRCPVRKVSLNPRLDPVLINGRAIGFC